MSILNLQQINYHYVDGGNKREILNNLSYSFEKGKFYTILGPSGSGKTTLLSIIAGLDTPSSGHVYYEDQDIQQMGLEKFRRNKMSIVFQQFNLISYLTALENVEIAMTETENPLPQNKKELALALLEKVGIVATKANRLVSQLSGGEQQRVAIARALATNVDLIFADEPTGNLDSETEQEIIRLFKSLTEDYGKTVIVVTHAHSVAAYSDHQLILKDKQIQPL